MNRFAFPYITTLSLACLAALAMPRAHARDASPLDPLDWLQEQEITADDGAPNQMFGNAVALHGTTAMVGAEQANGVNEEQGAVYVFDHSGSSWTQSQKLTAGDGASFDTFGSAVAFQGDTALVGAYTATVDSSVFEGAVYVFTRSNGTWSQVQKLTANDGTEFTAFGDSVSLDGTTALVGAPLNNGGGAYVFQQSGGTWTQSQKLNSDDQGPSDQFGYAVRVEGSTAFVGAYGNNQFQGAVYVFTESGGTWSETQKLTADDGTANAYFGYSIAVTGSTLMVGAWGDGSNLQGAAYVFTNSNGTWTQTQKLTPDDVQIQAKFGHSVAIDGTHAVIGADGNDNQTAQGVVYVFDESGGTWSQSQKLYASDGQHNDQFGFPVTLDGDRALVGAWGWPAGANQGAAYFFTTQAAPDDTIFADGFDGATP